MRSSHGWTLIRHAAVVVIVALTSALALVRAQTDATSATGVIAGTVVAADTGRAIRGATVTLTAEREGGSVRGLNATTDAQGHFAFVRLEPGVYGVSAIQAGYLLASFGQKHPGLNDPGTAIHLEANQEVRDVTLRLVRAGAISGRIVDERGVPARGAAVVAMSVDRGTSQLLGRGQGTDDRGVYRISGLNPGRYLIAAIARPLRNGSSVVSALQPQAAAGPPQLISPLAGAPVYFPGSLSAEDATPVELLPAQELTNVDIPLISSATAGVDGRVVGPGGGEASGVVISLTGRGVAFPFTGGLPNSGSSFRLTGVPSGVYTLTATAKALGTGVMLWAELPVTVDAGGVHNLLVTLRPGIEVIGRIGLDRLAPAPAPLKIQVAFRKKIVADTIAFVASFAAEIDADGRFVAGFLTPGHYSVGAVLVGPQEHFVVSAMVGGRDALDFGLDVPPDGNVPEVVMSFTDRVTEISGLLQDVSGRSTSDGYVIAFPASPNYWTPDSRRISAVRPDTSGHFRIRGLPAGEYRLVGRADFLLRDRSDPSVLRSFLALSTTVTLVDGGVVTQDVRIR